MVANLFRGNAFQCEIHSIDIDLRTSRHLLFVETWLDKDIGQEGIVDLQHKPCIDDGAIFFRKFLSEREEIFFVGLVVFVDADARRSRRWQEDMFVCNARRCCGSLHILDVDLEKRLAAILYRSNANDRRNRQHRAAHHRFLEILGIIFRKALTSFSKITNF